MKSFGTNVKAMAVLGVLMGAMFLASAAPVTFRVNMSGQMALGRFNPAAGDSVGVSGDTLNNWSSPGFPLTVSSSNTNLYVGTFTVSDQATVYYKYVIKSSGGASRWENNNNRIFSVTNGAQTVPISFFNNYLGHIVGADMSMVDFETNWFTYKVNGRAEDPFLILKGKGFNFVRLRLLTSSDAQAQADPNNSLNNLTYTVPEAVRVKAAGLQFLLDFTYCDAWGSGPVPSAWTNLSFTQLVQQMRTYNSNCIAAFKAAGAMPDFVQVGNELWEGFLCPYGQVGGSYDTPAQWSQFGQLMKAAIQGIQDAAGPTQMPVIVIHAGEPNAWFFDNLIQQGVSFDVIGQSYYECNRGSVTNTGSGSLGGNATDMLGRYNKAQIVAETSFPWSPAATNWFGISATPAGQVEYVSGLSNAVRNVPGGQIPGVFWWGTEYVGYSWAPACWGGMFDGGGNVLPVADVFGMLPAASVGPTNLVNGAYKIVDGPGYALEDPGSGGDGTLVDQSTYHAGLNQQWIFTLVTNNQYKITCAANGLALDGATWQLAVHPYTGASSQLWTFLPDGSYYNLINVGTGWALDDWSGGLGVKVISYAADATNPNQQWTLNLSAAPATPIGLGASATNTQITLTWNPASGATGYNLKRATNNGGSYTVISSPAGTNSTDAAVANGRTYYYVVSATNVVGEGANSSPAAATMPKVVIAMGAQTKGRFNLTFQGASNQAYVFEGSTNLTSWTPLLTNTPVNGWFNYTATNLTDPKRFYRIRQ